MSKLIWELEAELLDMKAEANMKIENNECETLRDFLDLGFNGTYIVGNDDCYWKGINGYEGCNEDPDENLLNTRMKFIGYDTDSDGYEVIHIKKV